MYSISTLLQNNSPVFCLFFFHRDHIRMHQSVLSLKTMFFIENSAGKVCLTSAEIQNVKLINFIVLANQVNEDYFRLTRWFLYSSRNSKMPLPHAGHDALLSTVIGVQVPHQTSTWSASFLVLPPVRTFSASVACREAIASTAVLRMPALSRFLTLSMYVT